MCCKEEKTTSRVYWILNTKDQQRLFQGDTDDVDVVVGPVVLGVGLGLADVLHDLHALEHAAEHRVLVVQVRLQGKASKMRSDG